MTTGIYLYCLREAGCSAAGGIKSPGVNGKGEVTVRVIDGMEAVVSAVNLDDFADMQKKAQDDVQWIKEKAVAHERVVEEAMGKSADNSKDGNFRVVPPEAGQATTYPDGNRDDVVFPVIPVKFGVIFNTMERLARVIGEQSAAIKAAFDRIRAKQEWSVKLFLKDNQQFKDQVRAQSEPLSAKSRTLAALPAGLAYFMEEELNADLERECSRRLDEDALKLFEELKPFAAEAALVKLLDSKLTGRPERMILNSAYLVPLSRWPPFQAAVAERRERLAPAGFLLDQSGPWPAYHFAEFAHEL